MSSRLLAIWLLAQLLSLTLSAAEIPLSAHFPRPPEKMAAHQMLVVQIAVSALIFPDLLQDLTATLFAIGPVIPMLALASLLSGDGYQPLLWSATIVIAWLFTLASWHAFPRAPHAKAFLVSIASLLALAPPCLAYFEAEYNPDQHFPWSVAPLPASFTPFSGQIPWPGLLFLTALATLGLACRHFHPRHSARTPA